MPHQQPFRPDHKKIGIMFVVLAFVMMARALAEATLMRAAGLRPRWRLPDARPFSQFFRTHGTIMIFFVVVPFLTCVINYVVPLQIGARDVSFRVLNSISLG